MTRYWKAFQTQQERQAWEKEMSEKDPGFKVCMRYPVNQLEKEMGMPKGYLSPNKFATIYRLDYDPVKGY